MLSGVDRTSSAHPQNDADDLSGFGSLLDHIVGAGEDRRWDGEAERPHSTLMKLPNLCPNEAAKCSLAHRAVGHRQPIDEYHSSAMRRRSLLAAPALLPSLAQTKFTSARFGRQAFMSWAGAWSPACFGKSRRPPAMRRLSITSSPYGGAVLEFRAYDAIIGGANKIHDRMSEGRWHSRVARPCIATTICGSPRTLAVVPVL